MSTPETPPTGDRRELVEFYLLDHRTPLGQAIDVALLGLNLVFVLVYVAETFPLSEPVAAWLWEAEVAIALIFLLEYGLRLYGAPDRLAEATNGYTVADLLSILPTLSVLLLPGVVGAGVSLGFLRALRVVRFLRFYRFTRDAEFFFGSISDEFLRVLRLGLTILTIFFLASGLFYEVEVGPNPAVEHFGDAFYYTVITVTTVGFGDIVPVTAAGRWVTILALLVGLIIVPWQVGRIIREWTSRETVDVVCPNCGLARHDPDASHCKACGHVIYQEYDPTEHDGAE